MTTDIPDHFYEQARSIRNGVIWESNAATRVIAEALYGAWEEGVAQYATTETVTPDVAALARRMRALQEHLKDQPLTHADDVDIATIGEAATALEALSAENERLRKALEPFAKAGELFPGEDADFDQCIYRPAAGDEYALSGNHLRAARRALEGGE